jgi:peptide/nickel transport system permease protein
MIARALMAFASTRAIGAILLGLLAAGAIFAPYLALYEPSTQFRDHLLAPPMTLHLRDAQGQWRGPFFYPLRIVDRLERRFAEDREHPVPLVLFANGRVIAPATAQYGPWLPLRSDRLGRDLFSRLLHGARLSLGVATIAVIGPILIGAFIGALAGYRGGLVDLALMRLTELVLVLPALYVMLAFRSILPLALPTSSVFLLMTTLMAAIGWPTVARGVRAIVTTEVTREYAMAARALGASPWRLLGRHILPATMGFLRVQALILLPSAILAEATLSYAGLGFGADHPSWGTLLQEASDIRAMADYPWLLSAAGAIVLVVLAVNLLLEQQRRPLALLAADEARATRP